MMDRPSNEEQDRNGLIPRPERCDLMSASQQNYNGVGIFPLGDFGLWMYEQSRGYTVRLFGAWTFNQ